MLSRHCSVIQVIVLLIVVSLTFSMAGCIKKKSVNSESTPKTATSGGTVTQPEQAATNPAQSGSPVATPPPSGSAEGNNLQSGQDVQTYGAYAPWTGRWETTFFKYGGLQHKTIFELKQSEIFVTGTYDWDNGKIDARQSKTSGFMTGTWSESPTYQAPDDAGDIEVLQSVDGNSFTGKWRYGFSGDWAGEWNGKRIR